MSEHIAEHIPALIEAMKEVPNYNRDEKLRIKRVENFRAIYHFGINTCNFRVAKK